VLASGATVVTTRSRIPADEFFKGIFATALAADELILGVEFPRPIAGRYLKFEQPASRFALVGVAVVRLPGAVRVALTGLGAGVCRWPEAEARLDQRFERAALEGLSLDPAGAYGDLHAPAEYRAHVAAVLLKRAVGELSPG
jgi:carbon-monoxide dehydrogenase medium subunit